MTIPELELLALTQSEQAEADNAMEIYYRHLQGNLNAIARNNPKKYPKYESLLPKKSCTRKKREKSEDEEMRKQADAIGMRIP